jgi:hypothetical protein
MGLLMDFKKSDWSKLGVNCPECAVVTLVLGPRPGEVLRNHGDLLHLVNVEVFPANVFTGFASSTYLVCP